MIVEHALLSLVEAAYHLGYDDAIDEVATGGDTTLGSLALRQQVFGALDCFETAPPLPEGISHLSEILSLVRSINLLLKER